jgi:hypothetical protein
MYSRKLDFGILKTRVRNGPAGMSIQSAKYYSASDVLIIRYVPPIITANMLNRITDATIIPQFIPN